MVMTVWTFPKTYVIIVNDRFATPKTFAKNDLRSWEIDGYDFGDISKILCHNSQLFRSNGFWVIFELIRGHTDLSLAQSGFMDMCVSWRIWVGVFMCLFVGLKSNLSVWRVAVSRAVGDWKTSSLSALVWTNLNRACIYAIVKSQGSEKRSKKAFKHESLVNTVSRCISDTFSPQRRLKGAPICHTNHTMTPTGSRRSPEYDLKSGKREQMVDD